MLNNDVQGQIREYVISRDLCGIYLNYQNYSGGGGNGGGGVGKSSFVEIQR